MPNETERERETLDQRDATGAHCLEGALFPMSVSNVSVAMSYGGRSASNGCAVMVLARIFESPLKMPPQFWPRRSCSSLA